MNGVRPSAADQNLKAGFASCVLVQAQTDVVRLIAGDSCPER